MLTPLLIDSDCTRSHTLLVSLSLLLFLPRLHHRETAACISSSSYSFASGLSIYRQGTPHPAAHLNLHLPRTLSNVCAEDAFLMWSLPWIEVSVHSGGSDIFFFNFVSVIWGSEAIASANAASLWNCKLNFPSLNQPLCSAYPTSWNAYAGI